MVIKVKLLAVPENSSSDNSSSNNSSSYPCTVCGKEYKHKTSLCKHRKTNHPAETIASGHHCSSCDKSFTFASGLSRHMRTHHLHPPSPVPRTFSCKQCGKQYNHHSSLSKHCKTAHPLPSPTATTLPQTENVVMAFINLLRDQHLHLAEQNRIILASQQSSSSSSATTASVSHHQSPPPLAAAVVANNHTIGGSTNIQTNNHTNSHNNINNNQFNLQFFLNETCKNAMNINQFVESIKVELSDLETIGKVGYVQGISDIIISNLNKLDITERPIHCTDKKREVIYVKKPDVWEKDCEKNNCVRNVIRNVRVQNQNMLPVFKQEHPDCYRSSSRYADQYNEMIMEVMVTETEQQDNKIIKRVCESTAIDRNSLH